MITVEQKLHPLVLRLLWATRTSGNQKSKKESGFTLLESIMALVVAGIMLTGIAPMIALSVAARVQARRVDLASQAARSYIDGVRSGTIPVPSITAALTTTTVNSSDTVITMATNVPAPSSVPSSSNPAEAVLMVSPNGEAFSFSNGNSFVIQPIRNGLADNAVNPSPLTQGFDLVVRVYRADAFNGGTTPNTLAGSDTAGAKIAIGNSVAGGSIFTGTSGSKYKPLVVMGADSTNPDSTRATTYSNYNIRVNTNPW